MIVNIREGGFVSPQSPAPAVISAPGDGARPAASGKYTGPARPTIARCTGGTAAPATCVLAALTLTTSPALPVLS